MRISLNFCLEEAQGSGGRQMNGAALPYDAVLLLEMDVSGALVEQTVAMDSRVRGGG